MATTSAAVLMEDDVLQPNKPPPSPDIYNVTTSNHSNSVSFSNVTSSSAAATTKRLSRRGSAGGSATTPAPKTNYKREIAALEFLLGIPMKAERDIVHQGWLQQNGIETKKKKNNGQDNMEDPLVPDTIPPLAVGHQDTWWEKWVGNPKQPVMGDPSHRSNVNNTNNNLEEEGELEQPHQLMDTKMKQIRESNKVAVSMVHAPGRRLMGEDSIRVEIPPELKAGSRQRAMVRMAAKREWELKVAHGIDTSSNDQHPPMLDGRIFFSAAESYPVQVFSVIRYEPKKEEAARRRKKLEARGGGGSEFIVPSRDWRGISYRALLPARHKVAPKKQKDGMMFDRFQSREAENNNNSHNNKKKGKGGKLLGQKELLTEDSEDDDDDETDEEELDTYVPGLLDDPEMTLGRHRNVMVGDRTTGCIVASTIQFVQPALLKADLNKQFRERFDGWEPPKVMRKFINAKIVDGIFTLAEDENSSKDKAVGVGQGPPTHRKRMSSVSTLSNVGATDEMIIRMPPSLTLSKIRSLKQQALMAALKAKLEISTVALAIVYFERLCLDCRIDKSNRRLSFAACLLLAIKINESHVSVALTDENDDISKTPHSGTTNRIQSLYRSTKKSNNMFAILLEFFTQEWEISLKHLMSAEWGVFAALQFRLHARPSQVAFHFKRLLKSLDWNPRRYLGGEMFSLWQAALAHEEYLRQEKQVRLELRQQKKEKDKLMRLQREVGTLDTIDVGADSDRGLESDRGMESDISTTKKVDSSRDSPKTPPRPGRPRSLGPKRQSRLGLSILNRFGTGNRRSASTERVPPKRNNSVNLESPPPALTTVAKMVQSPSLPTLNLLLEKEGQDSETLGSNTLSNTIKAFSEHGGDDKSEHSETSVIMV